MSFPFEKMLFCDITSLAGQIYGKWLAEHTPYKAYSSKPTSMKPCGNPFTQLDTFAYNPALLDTLIHE